MGNVAPPWATQPQDARDRPADDAFRPAPGAGGRAPALETVSRQMRQGAPAQSAPVRPAPRPAATPPPVPVEPAGRAGYNGKKPGKERKPSRRQRKAELLGGSVSISTHRSDLGARAARAGLWGVLVLVVVCVLGLVLHEGRTAAPQPTNSAPPAGPGAGGFAAVFMQHWLPAGQGTETDLQPYMSDVPSLDNKPNSRYAAQPPIVLSSTQVSAGYWSVLLAVDEVAKDRTGKLKPAGTHWYRVSVAQAGTTGATPGSNDSTVFQVTSAPYEVPAPVAGNSLTNSAYGDASVPVAGPIGDTAQHFLDAYLTGNGEIERYTSPGVTISPVTPPSASKVTVQTIAAIPVADDAQDADTVPADGVTVHVLVQTTVTGSAGSDIPMDYPLTLRSRAGRWEVLSLDSAPVTQRASGAASPQPSDSSEPSGSPSVTP
ncbi:MAG TPA: conjugal transfer protein [Streptosporangiales bacterium]